MKRTFILITFLILLSGLNAQEVITNLTTNPVLQSYVRRHPPVINKSTSISRQTSITLPFFDDFNSKDIYPSQERWVDKDAYVNPNYAINPPNIGTATLDAINGFGEIYPDATPGPLPFIADHLTSRPIRLDSIFEPEARPITVGDSIYMSFYYQPQGRGNDPQPSDSLILEFGVYAGDSIFSHVDSITVVINQTYYPNDSILLPCKLPDSIYLSVNPYLELHNSQLILLPGDVITLPCDSIFVPELAWHEAWATPGIPFDTSFYNPDNPLTYFHRVMIPLTDSSRYFTDHFVFRFKNYVSLADNSLPSWQSNMDHWNIDFVYLNTGRRASDTTYRMLSFIESAPSLLKHYEAMPYNQYTGDPIPEMKDSLHMVITNLDTISHNTNYKYLVTDQNSQLLFSCLQGNWDIPPVYSSGYLDYINFSRPSVCFSFFPVYFGSDSALFTITHILSSGTGNENLGDTISFEQKFYNYYAYDDGTPEAGYGLSPAGSELAYRFNLNNPDTLRAVQMYFNETRTGANQQYFYLTVWDDDNGTPNHIIYSQSGIKPEFSKSLDEFYTYYLDSIVPVVGTFYVGWVQTTNDNLNVGFDRQNQAQDNIYYNVTGVWQKSIQQGSLLIRPVLGKAIHPYPTKAQPKPDEILFNPNPVNKDKITILLPRDMDDLSSSGLFEMNVYNIMGQKVYAGAYQYEFNITSFHNGVYIFTVRDNIKNRFYTGKLIISR
jgi:hypothetical protein